MASHNIVAVVGMCGSGKSVATDIFEKKGYTRIYFGDATFKKMNELGLEFNSENEEKVRNMLRSSGDMGIYARIFLPDIEKAVRKGNVVVESMYSWSEYKLLKEKFKSKFKVLCVVCDAPIRRERLKTRAFRPLTEKESLQRDYNEIENIEKGGPIGIADHYILNNGGITALRRAVLKFIKELS